MGVYGGFYKGDKKKPKKEVLERKAMLTGKFQSIPQVEILGKKGK